jgi:DNA-binding IscR family transcriptional regulator
VRLWLAAHVCWPGRTGDSDYRALVALITAAHDEGGRVFLASERVLTQYAFLSRSALVDALNRLVAAGIVKRTKLNGASSKYELHQAGWRVLLARTPEGVVRHPDERRIVQLKMRTPVTQFPVPALRPAELGPCIHLLLSKTPSNPKDQEECSHGPSSAASAVHAPGTGADWPFINKETSTRKWLPCHPAFGPRRLNQRVYLLCRNANPVPAEWIASVMGASVRAVREHLAKLVAAGLVREVGGKYLRCSDATRLLDQIAADNGGMSALRNMVARVKQDQLDYHGDPYIVDKLKLTDAYLAQFNEDPLIDPVPEPQPPAPSTPPIPEPPTAMQEVDQQDDEPLTIDDDMLAAIFDDIDFSQPEPQGETWQQRVDRYRDWPPTDEA